MENASKLFWDWIDAHGGDYKVGRALGKPNGTFLTNSRNRNSLPKPDTMADIAKVFPDFPVTDLIPSYAAKPTSEPINPGAASDGYNAAEMMNGWKQLVEEKEKTIARLEEYLNQQNDNIAFLKEIIKKALPSFNKADVVSQVVEAKTIEFRPRVHEISMVATQGVGA